MLNAVSSGAHHTLASSSSPYSLSASSKILSQIDCCDNPLPLSDSKVDNGPKDEDEVAPTTACDDVDDADDDDDEEAPRRRLMTVM